MFEQTKLRDNLLCCAVQAAESCMKSLKNSLTSAICRDRSKFCGRCRVCGECGEKPAKCPGYTSISVPCSANCSKLSTPLTLPGLNALITSCTMSQDICSSNGSSIYLAFYSLGGLALSYSTPITLRYCSVTLRELAGFLYSPVRLARVRVNLTQTCWKAI